MALRVKTKANNKLNENLEPTSPTSEYFLTEVATLYVLCIFELEIPIDSSSIYAFFNDVFLESYPRFSCIPIEDKQRRRNVWKKVEVNVEDHIKFSKFPEHLSPENYSDHFDDYMSKIATSQLPKDKPLWEVHTFNYPTKNNVAATLIVKFHHAVGDGTSLMGVVFSCFKRVDDPTLPLTFPSTTRTSSSKGHQLHDFKATLMKVINIVPKFLCSMLYNIYDFGQTLRVLLVEDDRTPIRSGITNMALPYSAKICSVTLSLTDVRRIKSLLKVTVNDVVIGIISFATRLYIQDADQGGRLNNARLTASMAVNMRSIKRFASPEEMRKENTWGNKFSIIEMPLPTLGKDDIRNPLNFVINTNKILNRKKRNVGAIYLTALTLDAIRIFGGFKAATRTFEKSWKNSTVAITNMIGPVDHISVGNHPIKGFYFVPTGLNLSLTVSVLSYMENLRLGLVVENGFIDHQRLVTCVETAYQKILQAANASAKSK
ncbi:hypothetical protein BVRB_3g056360 [Beta vulgaris subsp. vulgaris]|nr:hypothetical protein BVRB_3g056360 [Beta vulgaris subsp. vulgaris]